MKPGSAMPIKGFFLRPALSLVLSGVLLAACGGTMTTPETPAGVNVGTADAFGSLVVNGILYDTAGASVVIDNAAGHAESELAVGMRVIVTGPFHDVQEAGSAIRIEVETALRGPMNDNGVDVATDRMIVLGQTVLVLPTTTFDNVSGLKELKDIQDNGALVRHPGIEIQGAVDDIGRIHATFIRKTSDDFPARGAVRLKGVVGGFQDNTFRIGAMNVTFAGTVSGLVDGAFAEVEGTFSAGPSPAVAATRVTIPSPSLGAAGENARLDGYVLSVPSAASFAVTGPGGPVAVDTSASTQFVNGSRSDLGPGSRVRVEGSVTASGLSARRVVLRPPNPIAMEAVVDSVDAAGRTLVLMGRTVAADAFTQFTDSAGGVRAFWPGGIGPGNTVRVVGHQNGVAIAAARVERIDVNPPNPSNLVTLQGPAANPNPGFPPILRILGITVTTGTVNTDYVDASGDLLPGTPIQAQSDFFSRLGDSTVVEVRHGLFTGGGAGGSVGEPPLSLRMRVSIRPIND